MARIFISYKRVDKEKVFKIKDHIEAAIGEKCWIDLDGIESDAQFKNVIIKAINECEIVLFMYSKAHSKIVDFEKDWTVRELNFAQKKNKRIVFVNLDRSSLTDTFEFDYGTKQQIDALSQQALLRLIEDLKKWLGVRNQNQNGILTKVQETKENSSAVNYRDHEPLVNIKKIVSICIPIIAIIFVSGYFILNRQTTVKKDSTLNDTTSMDGAIITTEVEETPKKIPADFILLPHDVLKHYEDDFDNNSYQPIYRDIELDSFYICTHEVIQSEFVKVMSTNPSKILGDSLPVNTLHFLEACRYCNERSFSEGYDGFYTISNNVVTINPEGNGYRLPTLYEWVLAARPDAKTKTKYAGGNNIKDIAWYGGNSKGTLHPVCKKNPNVRGIYDLNGNVSEWLWAKPFSDCNVHIGSDYETYISFGESESVGNWIVQKSNGVRVVLIPRGMNNRNTAKIPSVKGVVKAYQEDK